MRGMVAEPFVGRDRDLRRLQDAFDEAASGKGGIVLVTGAPGVGKTSVVREFGNAATASGARVLWGRAHETSGAPPLWPWTQALRSLVETADPESLEHWVGDLRSELARLLPSLAAAQTSPGSYSASNERDDAQFQLYEAVVRFINAAADAAPLVIVLDDLHWADRETLLLLEHAAFELAEARVLLVGIYRDVELGRRHPLQDALGGVLRAPRAATIELRGLARAEVARYVRSAMGQAPSEALDAIYRATEGNPFYLREVVRLALQEGSSAIGEMHVPPSIRSAVGHRLNRLPDASNELLRAAAVIGRDFAGTLLASAILDDDRSAMTALLVPPLDAGLIEEEAAQPGTYRFVHALVQETLLEELRPSELVTLHGQVAHALERLAADRLPAHASELARHFLEAAPLSIHDAERAVRYSRLAGEQAETQLAWDEACRHYANCLEVDARWSILAPQERALTLHARCICARRADLRTEAWESLLEAIDLYREQGDGMSAARAAAEAARGGPSLKERARIVDAGLADLSGRDPRTEAALLVNLAVPGLFERQHGRLAKLISEHGLEDIDVVRRTRQIAGTLALSAQPPEDASACAELHAYLDEHGQTGYAAQVLGWGAWAIAAGGDLDEAAAAFEAALEYARRHGLTIVLSAQQLALLHSVRRRTRARDALVDAGAIHGSAWPLARAELELERGDIEAALAALPSANGNWGSRPYEYGLRSRVLFHAGRVDGAREAAAELVAASRRRAFPAFRGLKVSVLALFTLDDVAESVLDRRTLEASVACAAQWLADGGERFPYDAVSGHATWRVLGSLLLAGGRSAEARQWIERALEWCEREGCPVEAGRCHVALAEVAARTGDTSLSVGHLDRAIERFAEHDAPFDLARATARRDILAAADAPSMQPRDGLSRREVEVLRLVAGGKTNQEIAAELVVTSGTVARHVSNILSKTGLTNRTQAAAYAMRHGLLE